MTETADEADKVFTHRTDEAMEYVPYRLVRNDLKPKHEDSNGEVVMHIYKRIPDSVEVLPDGTPVEYHNRDAEPIERITANIEGRKICVAEVYRTDVAEEFAVKVLPLKAGYNETRKLARKGAFLDRLHGRIATPVGFGGAMFILDASISKSTVEIARGRAIRDIWEILRYHSYVAKNVVN